MTTRINVQFARGMQIAVVLGALAATQSAAQKPVQIPVPSGPTMGSALLGPPPTGVSVSGTPAIARVTWSAPGASSYSVQRWMQHDPNCCRVTSPSLGARQNAWDDAVTWSGTYVYRITATYSDGRQGSVDVNYVRPEPKNPASLSAVVEKVVPDPRKLWGVWVNAGNTVHVVLQWPTVPGAAYYGVWGPGLPAGGMQVPTVLGSSDAVPATLTLTYWSAVPDGVTTVYGDVTWSVAAFFLPGPVGTAVADFTKRTLRAPTP